MKLRSRVGCRARILPLILGLGAFSPLDAQVGGEPGDTLLVGTKDAPPFAILEEDGAWAGIGVELWRLMAEELGYATSFRGYETVPTLLDSIAAGPLAAGAAAITITPEREARLDFTHPYFVTGLAIAVSGETEGGWIRVARQFFSLQFLRLVLVLLTLLLIVGALIWMFERRRNEEQFGGTTPQGVGSGMWWSAVTMTTVGYGDKAPRTLGGRIVALIWMFVAIIIISSFTAAITSALTLGEMGGPVASRDDLAAARVGTVAGSTSAQYLDRQAINAISYSTLEAAVEALRTRRLDAVVYDEPILRWMASRDYRGEIRVLPETFETQYYGFALPQGSPLREPLNRQLLQLIDSAEWEVLLRRYLGR